MREEIAAEIQVWAIFLFMTLALLVSITYNVRQRERIANFQNMINSLPVDFRAQSGRRINK